MEQGMIKNVAVNDDLGPLLDLAGRVGRNPLLTQASTGNISLKLDGVLWIKASGKWLADATGGKILIPLDLAGVHASIWQNIDPAELYPNASIETAMHVTLPHPVVLHVHSVNTIAWAVREDAAAQLEARLDGLRWQWIPYVASGLPLAREIERVLSANPDTDVAGAGKPRAGAGRQGLSDDGKSPGRNRTAAGDSAAPGASRGLCSARGTGRRFLLGLARRRRHPRAGDGSGIEEGPGGRLSLSVSGDVLGRTHAELFHAAPDVAPDPAEYAARPFVIVKGRGVVLNRTMTPAEIAMLSGLAQVVQRIGPSAPLRYLSEDRGCR